MHQRLTYALIIFLFCCPGCEKSFLQSEHTGSINLNHINDYDLLLNADIIITQHDWSLDFFSDNFVYDPSSSYGVASEWMYTWQDDLHRDDKPALWQIPYSTVNYYNTVLQEIDRASGNDTGLKQRLKGEALLGRAFSHWLLVNLYSKTYHPAGSATDPGIPYITGTDVYAPNPGRSTVQAVYDKIVADIEAAVPLLPANNELNYRGSRAAAYALLSRVYLFSMQYAKAVAAANDALNLQHTLLDYTVAGFQFPKPQLNPEFIYMRLTFDFEMHKLSLSDEFDAMLPASDARKLLYKDPPYISRFHRQAGLTVQEVMLNKAEALIRQSGANIPSALNILHTLAAKRDRAPASLQTSDAEQALTWVLAERRRELFVTGLRWHDMRRLAAEGRMKPVVHTLGRQDYTLTADSKKYTLLIPKQVLLKNPGMPQNER